MTDPRSLLTYDAASGILRWRARTPDMFQATDRRSAAHICANWNSKYAGSVAGTDHFGYVRVNVEGKLIFAHVLAHLFMTGTWPTDQKDHIDHNRSNNSWSNLRDASDQTNRRNQSKNRLNTSGHHGVYWYKAAQKWTARIQVNGKQIHLGCFTKIEDAIAARTAADVEYGFHPNHGKEL